MGYRIVFSLLALGALSALRAQDVNPTAAASAPGPATPTAPAAHPPPPPARTVESGEIASMLAASMPKYDPPKPPPKQVDPDVDLRDIDKPRNDIIRLPKYVVHGEKPAVFRERDLYTKSGLGQLALLRYRGLNVGFLPGLNQPIAEQMYRDDERLQNMAALQDTADTMRRGGDSAESIYIMRASNDTFIRGLDWGAPAPQNPSAAGAPGSP
jgi:hypothetical protein